MESVDSLYGGLLVQLGAWRVQVVAIGRHKACLLQEQAAGVVGYVLLKAVACQVVISIVELAIAQVIVGTISPLGGPRERRCPFKELGSFIPLAPLVVVQRRVPLPFGIGAF